MSDHPFDDLARTLASGASRRGVLKALLATAAGSLFAGGQGGVALAAGCHRNGLGCDTNSQCCSGFCQTQNGESRCTCPPRPVTDARLAT